VLGHYDLAGDSEKVAESDTLQCIIK